MAWSRDPNSGFDSLKPEKWRDAWPRGTLAGKMNLKANPLDTSRAVDLLDWLKNPENKLNQLNDVDLKAPTALGKFDILKAGLDNTGLKHDIRISQDARQDDRRNKPEPDISAKTAQPDKQPKAEKPEQKPAAPQHQQPAVKPAGRVHHIFALAAHLDAHAKPALAAGAKPKEFNFDKAVNNIGELTPEALRARLINKKRDQYAHGGNSEDREEKEEFERLLDRMRDQNEEDYKRALEATEERIRELEERERVLVDELDEIETRRERSRTIITECRENIDKKQQHLDDLKFLAGVSDEHGEIARKAREAQAEADRHEAEIKSLSKFKITSIGKDTYFETTGENGPAFYKIGKDGKPEEIKDPDEIGNIMSASLKPTFMRKAADGSIEYLNKDGEKLDQNKTDQINQFLNALGKKPEDIMTNYDDYKKAVENPQGIAAQENWDRHLERATDSEERLRRLSTQFGVPVENLRNLPKIINDATASLELDKSRLEKELEKLAKDDKAWAEKNEELRKVRADLIQAKDYQDKLQKGEIKKGQLLSSMPDSISKIYRQKVTGTAIENNNPDVKTNLSQNEISKPSLFQKAFKASDENTSLLQNSTTQSSLANPSEQDTKQKIASTPEETAPKTSLFKMAFQAKDAGTSLGQKPSVEQTQPILTADNTSRASGMAATLLDDGKPLAGSDKSPATQFQMAAVGTITPAPVANTPEEEPYIVVARSLNTSAHRPG